MSVNEQLLNIWQEAWRPPDRQPVWQWAEEHIRSIPYSPMPGRFRIANSRMIQEVMDAIVDPHVRLVSIVASVQSSKTTAPEVALCYIKDGDTNEADDTVYLKNLQIVDGTR